MLNLIVFSALLAVIIGYAVISYLDIPLTKGRKIFFGIIGASAITVTTIILKLSMFNIVALAGLAVFAFWYLFRKKAETTTLHNQFFSFLFPATLSSIGCAFPKMRIIFVIVCILIAGKELISATLFVRRHCKR